MNSPSLYTGPTDMASQLLTAQAHSTSSEVHIHQGGTVVATPVATTNGTEQCGCLYSTELQSWEVFQRPQTLRIWSPRRLVLSHTLAPAEQANRAD